MKGTALFGEEATELVLFLQDWPSPPNRYIRGWTKKKRVARVFSVNEIEIFATNYVGCLSGGLSLKFGNFSYIRS